MKKHVYTGAIAAAEVDPAPHIAAGLLLGGDPEQLTASLRAFAKGSMKALVNLVSTSAVLPQFHLLHPPEFKQHMQEAIIPKVRCQGPDHGEVLATADI
jgi:hypothetical protein